MTNSTNQTNKSYPSHPSSPSNSFNEKILFQRGGYRNLKSYQMATLVHDLNMEFCQRYVDRRSRTRDQMEQAGRSGRQNIAEGSLASATSKKTEIKLTNVARASMEELLLDYEDFLRQRQLKMWAKDSEEAKAVRNLVYSSNRSHQSYSSYLNDPETGANIMICIIHQTNYLLDQQIRKLEKDFLEKGGFTERLYQKRKEWRERN
jgi:restriction system protein